MVALMTESSLDSIEQKAEAARLMALTTVGGVTALRCIVTLLLAGKPVSRETAAPLVDALMNPASDDLGTFREEILMAIDDICFIADALSRY